MEAPQTDNTRLTAPELCLVNALELNPVCGCPLLKPSQTLEFDPIGGHDELSATLDRNRVFFAEPERCLGSFLAESRFEAAGW